MGVTDFKNLSCFSQSIKAACLSKNGFVTLVRDAQGTANLLLQYYPTSHPQHVNFLNRNTF